MSTPQITFFAPSSGTVHAAGAAVEFKALVSDATDAPTDLTLSWVSDLDGAISTQGATDSTGVITFSLSSLSSGVHIITGTVTNSLGFSSYKTKHFRVNALPTAPTVSLSPSSPGAGDALTVAIDVESTDAESDPITYSYAWYKDGVLSPASATTILPASATASGESWKVVVTPNDGFQNGPAGEATVSISTADVGAANLCTITGTFLDSGGYHLSGVKVRFSPDLETARLTGVGFIAEDIEAESDANGLLTLVAVRGITGLLTISGTDLVRRVTIPSQASADLFDLSSTGTDLLEVQELELVELPRRS